MTTPTDLAQALRELLKCHEGGGFVEIDAIVLNDARAALAAHESRAQPASVSEAMTLERVHAEIALLKRCVLTPLDSQRIYDLLCAVEKDLSRAAEPVCPVYQYLTIFGWEGCYWRDCSKDDYDKQPTHLRRILFTRPPEPAQDAKDAARYRWLRDRMYRFEIEAGVLDSKAFAERPRIGYGREIDSAIDNAMTKENGNG